MRAIYPGVVGVDTLDKTGCVLVDALREEDDARARILLEWPTAGSKLAGNAHLLTAKLSSLPISIHHEQRRRTTAIFFAF